MKIKFASDIIKLTFCDQEPFSGRDITMKGEALYSGFDAALSTMTWLSTKEKVNNADKEVVRNMIEQHNKNSKFVIMFMEE